MYRSVDLNTWKELDKDIQQQYRISLNTEPILVSQDNIQYILSNITFFHNKQRFAFYCERCGKYVEYYKKAITNPPLCQTCKNQLKWKTKTPEELYARNQKRKATCLKRYGVESTNQIEAVKEKIKQTNLKKYGVTVPAKSKAIREKMKKTCREKYGVDYSWQAETVKEKIKSTCLERYGVENAFQSEEIKQRQKNTCIERYGVENTFQAEEIKEKIRKTFKERYNVEHALQNNEFLEKAKQTTFDRYGVDIAAKSEVVQKRMRQTNFERYGKACSLSIPEVRAKGIQTCLEKYGVKYPLQSSKIKERIKQTCLEKYGVEHYTQTEEFFKIARKQYIYNGIKFNSSWELYYWIWATENGHNIIQEPVRFEYEVNSKKHYYFPDFEIDGRLIEIKGSHFFDDKGNMINPFDSAQNDIFEAKHQCGLQNGVEFITNISEAKEYVDSKYTSDFVNLFRTSLPFPYPNNKFIDSSDSGLIRYFHKSIYDASIDKHLSPKEAWKDKDLVHKVALNRLKYIGSCKPEDILRGFSVTKKAPKVSVFKHTLAQRIIETYASEYNTIFDPFSGFSGRMLGAIRNGKNYKGQDLSEIHIEESKQLLQWLKDNQDIEVEVNLKVQDVLTDEEKTFEDTCLFTCSPYGSKESWNEGEVQMSCDEWIEVCLKKYKCNKYIFVVDETEQYKDYIVETLENKSHFGSNNEYIVVI